MKKLLAVVFAYLLPLVATLQAQVYRVIDLGDLGGGSSEANGINNLGQIVGNSMTKDGVEHPFLYSNGSMQDLKGLVPSDNSYAYAINDLGQVTGRSVIDPQTDTERAFLFSNGSMKDLGTFGGASSYGFAINDNGQVVGNAYSSDNIEHAFLSTPGSSLADLTTLNLDGSAHGINDSGQVVGHAFFNGKTYNAFLYSNGTIKDLGTLGGNDSYAFGINAKGDIVGRSGNSQGVQQAFFYSNGKMVNIGGYDAQACSINSSDEVTGTDNNHAFFYYNGVMENLNDVLEPGSGWNLENASAINDSGAISGWGINPEGQEHAFVLEQVTPPPGLKTPDQAPTLLLFPLGLAFLAFLRRR